MTIDAGFFVQKHVNDVIAMKDMRAAVAYVTEVIDSFIKDHPQVHADNVRKAKAVVSKSRTPMQLAMAIQNFILAHPSEGLKVI